MFSLWSSFLIIQILNYCFLFLSFTNPELQILVYHIFVSNLLNNTRHANEWWQCVHPLIQVFWCALMARTSCSLFSNILISFKENTHLLEMCLKQTIIAWALHNHLFALYCTNQVLVTDFVIIHILILGLKVPLR